MCFFWKSMHKKQKKEKKAKKGKKAKKKKKAKKRKRQKSKNEKKVRVETPRIKNLRLVVKEKKTGFVDNGRACWRCWVQRDGAGAGKARAKVADESRSRSRLERRDRELLKMRKGRLLERV